MDVKSIAQTLPHRIVTARLISNRLMAQYFDELKELEPPMSKWDFFCGDAFDSDNTELELVDPSDDLEDNNTAFDLIS